MIKKHLPRDTSNNVNKFLSQVAKTPLPRSSARKGRLVFAMDATASREPTWERACQLHAEMFKVTDELGGLSIQLCYYRGLTEFRTFNWSDNETELAKMMADVTCLGGHTQIRKVLKNVLVQQDIKAVVFIGDAIEENPDILCQLAGELGLLNTPLFIFQEGSDSYVKKIFKQMAKLSRGAYAPFDLNSATELKLLLSAVAIFAAGGQEALEKFSKDSDKTVARLTRQLRK